MRTMESLIWKNTVAEGVQTGAEEINEIMKQNCLVMCCITGTGPQPRGSMPSTMGTACK